MITEAQLIARQAMEIETLKDQYACVLGRTDDRGVRLVRRGTG